MLVRADNSFASRVVNLPASRRTSNVWPSFHVSLIQSNALSGSVEADMTASLVRILQFLQDSAWGNAGTLIVSASLALFLSLDGPLGLPKRLSILRMNLRSLSSESPSSSAPSSSPSPGPPPGARLHPWGGFFPRLSFLSCPGASLPFESSAPGGSSPGVPPPALPPLSDGARLVGGRVGDLRPVISVSGWNAAGALPSWSIISHISWFGAAGLDALADANELSGAVILTSVVGGMVAVAVWTIGTGNGPKVFRSLLILMFMNSVCNCWALICSLCCWMMDSSCDNCIFRLSSCRS